MAINSDIRDQAYEFFIEEAPELLQAIESGLLTLKQDRSVAHVHELMRAAHSIKGGAASVELEAISVLAHRLEDIFKALYSDDVEIDTDLEGSLLEAYDCLRFPLIEQMNFGEHNAEQALVAAEPVFAKLEARLEPALAQTDNYIPSSADLGIDITVSLFEVDVTQGLERLTAVSNAPQDYEIAGELRAQAEVFGGFSELLNLPGFGAIAQAVLQAVEIHPDCTVEILHLALADFRAGQQAVLDGDRTQGGTPSEALLALADTPENETLNPLAGPDLDWLASPEKAIAEMEFEIPPLETAADFSLADAESPTAPTNLEIPDEDLPYLDREDFLSHADFFQSEETAILSNVLSEEDPDSRLEEIFGSAVFADDENIAALAVEATPFLNREEIFGNAVFAHDEEIAAASDSELSNTDETTDETLEPLPSDAFLEDIFGGEEIHPPSADATLEPLPSDAFLEDIFGGEEIHPPSTELEDTPAATDSTIASETTAPATLEPSPANAFLEDIFGSEEMHDSSIEPGDLLTEVESTIEPETNTPETNTPETLEPSPSNAFLEDVFGGGEIRDSSIDSKDRVSEADSTLASKPGATNTFREAKLFPLEDITGNWVPAEDPNIETVPPLPSDELTILSESSLEHPAANREPSNEPLAPAIQDRTLATSDSEDLSAPLTKAAAVTELEDAFVPLAMSDLEDLSASLIEAVAIAESEELSASLIEAAAVTDSEDLSAPLIEAAAVTDSEDLSTPLIETAAVAESENLSAPLTEIVAANDLSSPVPQNRISEASKSDASIEQASNLFAPVSHAQDINTPSELFTDRASDLSVPPPQTQASETLEPKDLPAPLAAAVEAVEQNYDKLIPVQNAIASDTQTRSAELPIASASVAKNELSNSGNIAEPLAKDASPKQVNPEPEQTNSLAERAPVSKSRNKTKRGAKLSVRVDLARLERIDNQMGELTINRNSLSLQNEQLQRSLRELLRRFSRFQSIAGRLQELSDRMLVLPERYHAEGYSPGSTNGTNSVAPLTDAGSSALQKGFDSLEMDRYGALHSLLQETMEEKVQIEESVDDIVLFAAQSNRMLEQQRQMMAQVQHEIVWARMIPLGEVLNRFPRVLRDLAATHGKVVKLKLSGTGVLVDKAMLEKLYDPLLHLLRNAFDHGIEPPEVRLKNGKPEQGEIEIRAYHQGNRTIIELQDDGRGLDPVRIGQRAVERGLVSAAQLRTLGPTQLLEFIFEPGFSTASRVSELSGRGVGLDVVRSQLRLLKGTVTVASSVGKGTLFTLRLPLTLTISKLLVCTIGSVAMALPSDSIEEVIVPKQEQMQRSGEQRFLYWRDRLVPTYRLADLFDYRCPLPENTSSKLLSAVPVPKSWASPLLIVRKQPYYFALEIERLVTEQELAIKPFGAAIAAPSYAYGCTILGDGSLVPVIDGSLLLDRITETNTIPLATTIPPSTATIVNEVPVAQNGEIPLSEKGPANSSSPAPHSPTSFIPTQAPTILVVDDSATIRRTLALSLQKAGYRILQARDGREALDQLQQNSAVQMVICDIEMPNMNGFEFLTQRRQDAKLAAIPVAMLTSRSSQKHRQLALQLGANEYFTKPYIEQDLLATIKNIIVQNNPEVMSVSH